VKPKLRRLHACCIFVAIAIVVSGCAALPGHLDRAACPKNVILYIGDGMGAAQRRLAEEVTGDTLAMNRLPVAGVFTNTPLQGKATAAYAEQNKIPREYMQSLRIITDSAASGTAMATGKKTENYAVSVGPLRETAYETIAEAAKRIGKSVGLITTSLITDATPAAFGAHVDDRSMMDEVAAQYVEQGFDVLMGGGWRYFLPKAEGKGAREDGRDLISAFTDRGYAVVRTREELAAIDADTADRILGLFSPAYMPYYLDRTDKEPDLPAMVDLSIEILSKNPNGFFLMVEGARIDHASHANDPGGTVGDLLELDRAVETGVDYLHEQDADTLVLVCADHETGGLSLGRRGAAAIRPSVIDGIDHSIEWLAYVLPSVPDAAVDRFMQHTGILDLTDAEKASIATAARHASKANGYKASDGKTSSAPGVAQIAADIINQRIGIGWATGGHSGMPILITADGPGSVAFTGYYDQTELANRIAALWGVALRSWPVDAAEGAGKPKN